MGINEDTTNQAVLTVTPAAAEKISGLIAEKNLSAEYGLRVFVSGGGCSGLQYGMMFENSPLDTDRVIETDGVKLIIDEISLPYLQGANIDFVDSLMGGGFRIDNPNAVTTCGCGHSFRTSGDQGSAASGGACGCH